MSIEPPRVDRVGMLDRMLNVVKGLTYTNVAIMALLLLLLVPVYLVYRILGDQNLMGAVFNVYSELDAPTDCLLAFQQPAGGSGAYIVRAVLAERNAEVWYVSVKLRFKPDDQAMTQYCGAATQVVDFANDPNNSPVPIFPGSDRKIVPAPRPAEPAKGGP